MTELKTPETIASSQFPVGMEILHDGLDAVADVCFVHGVTGGRRSAWTAHQQSEPWVKTLLPSHLDKIRILSFGYDPFHGYFQDSRHLHNHASDLLTDIVDYRRQAPLRPLIFITHCIGGLVCQEAINVSHASHDEHSANVYFALRGIISLGMPYLGKYRKAQWEPKGVTRLIQNEHSRDDRFDYNLLRANFFRAMKYRPKTSTPVNITFLFTVVDNEGLPPVASEMFAVGYHVNFEFVPLRAKHADMVKISSAEDKCFRSIVERLNEWTVRIGRNQSSFNTRQSTDYTPNRHLGRQPERDHTIKQSELLPGVLLRLELYRDSTLSAVEQLG